MFLILTIASASLGLGPGDLINDLKIFGFVFENLCVRDLRVYADVLDGKVFHYRDKSNLECVAVVHLANGKYSLVEIKLGGQENIDKGAVFLLKLASRIDDGKMSSPSFLMVLTGIGSYAYRNRCSYKSACPLAFEIASISHAYLISGPF